MTLPSPQARLPETTRYDRIAVALLVLLTLFRFWYAGHHELLQDESYYWQWSRHLDWGYYDNTPLVALVIRVCTSLLGSTELGVRAGAVLCSLVISSCLYILGKRLLSPLVGLAALVLSSLMPIFAAGAVIMTQDPVQLAFWSLTLVAVHTALTGRAWHWILAGVLAGLAAQSKLNALLLLPSVFLYLVLSPTARERWLRRPEPYVAGVIALVIFLPFVWWNHTHENAFWIHIGAMGSRASAHDGLKWFWRFIGDQAVLVSPLFFLTYLYALRDGFVRGVRQKDDAILFLWCPSVVVFGATALMSLRSKIEGNWAVAAYITGMILVASVLVRAWQSRRVGARVWTGLGIGVAIILSIAAVFPNLLYGVGLKFKNPTKDRTNELYGWDTLASRLATERAQIGGDPFIFGINYRMPSEAAFYLHDQPQTYSLFLHDRANEYLFWEDPKALVGRNAIFVNDTDTPDKLDEVKAVFARVEVQPPLLIYRNPPYGNKPIRTIQIFRCTNFRGYDRRQWQDGW